MITAHSDCSCFSYPGLISWVDACSVVQVLTLVVICTLHIPWSLTHPSLFNFITATSAGTFTLITVLHCIRVKADVIFSFSLLIFISFFLKKKFLLLYHCDPLMCAVCFIHHLSKKSCKKNSTTSHVMLFKCLLSKQGHVVLLGGHERAVYTKPW